jgi:aarF domain-containing kinase
VILDFGLVTEIDDEQKFGMIDAIAHLIHRDYARIGEDFVNLDFIPRGTDVDPIVPVLSRVFDAALAGGGAKSINFQELAADLAEITFKYPFRIPPYFALIIRAIGVLEGIALTSNPNFAIIDEAYPYISYRLLTDPGPRLRESLRYMVYGESRSFDVERVIDILGAFEKFQATDGVKDSGAAQLDRAREAARFIFSSDGSLLRNFLLDEVVEAIDVVLREQTRARAPQAFTPQSLLAALVPTVGEDDKHAVASQQLLLDYLFKEPENSQSTADNRERLQRLQQLAPLVTENAEEIRRFSLQVSGRLAERQTARSFGWLRDVLELPQQKTLEVV